MTVRVIGAGLPRTGTRSLSIALERLLGGRCYHMDEVFEHLDHVDVWRWALRGQFPVWEDFFADYVAAIDWPVSAFVDELAEVYPDALVLLSVRDSPETWWASADPTVLEVARRDELPEYGDWLAMFKELLTRRLTDRWNDPPSAMAAYERHNERIRSTIHAARLLVWSPDQGWEPICRALGLPVPNEPFPHVNKREEW